MSAVHPRVKVRRLDSGEMASSASRDTEESQRKAMKTARKNRDPINPVFMPAGSGGCSKLHSIA
jgi:hypothetical protein